MKNFVIESSSSVASHEAFRKLLKRLSAAEIRNYIEQEAKRDESFLHRFIIQFVEQSGFPAEERFSLLTNSILKLARNEKNDSGILMQQMNHLTERARKMIDEADFLDAYFIAVSIIVQQLAPDEKLKSLWDQYVIKSFHLLIAISKSEAGLDLKEKIFEFLIADAGESVSKSSHEVRANWMQALVESASEESQLNLLLQNISEMTGRNRNQFGAVIDEHEEELLIKAKMKVLQKSDRGKDIHRLLEANKNIREFRDRLIDDALQKNDLEQAKELIKEGKRLEERDGKIHVSTHWNELLLKIAQQENDVKSVRNLALQLFITSEFDFDYYHLLRQHYDPARWKSQVDRIVLHIRKQPSFATKGIHAIAKIFIEEEDWEKLLLLLQKNANLEFVELHFNILKEKFPKELLEIYRRAVRRFAEKYMGNEAYRTVANTLRKMQSLPGGREMVQSLAIELKVDYHNRKSFVDELNKVAL